MISWCSFLIDQPSAMNRLASQSSSSGCDGDSPWRPKSLAVRTRPCPKCQAHTRLTITRAVSGFFGLAMSSASSFRPLASLGKGLASGLRSTERYCRGAGSPGDCGLPRMKTLASNGLSSARAINRIGAPGWSMSLVTAAVALRRRPSATPLSGAPTASAPRLAASKWRSSLCSRHVRRRQSERGCLCVRVRAHLLALRAWPAAPAC